MNLAPLIYALGWSLLHSLWQGALLAGMAYVLVSVFYLSAKEKVNLLFTFLCVLLFAFIGTFISYLPDSTASNNLQAPISLEGLMNPSVGVNSDELLALERYFPYMALFYGLGVCFQLVRLIGGYIRIGQLRRAEKTTVPESWGQLFSHLNGMMGVRRKVGFYLSEKIEIPTVIGFFKPLILFPIAALSALDLRQVETILIHELSHIRRNDYLLNVVKCLVEAILFFNPFVRVLSRMLEKEREYTCDDEVLNYGGDVMVYAYALLSLESLRTKNSPALALGAFTNKEHLLQRIKRITLMKTATLNMRHKLSAMALLIAGALGLAWINPANDTIPAPPKPPVLAAEKPPVPPAPVNPSVAPLTPLAPLAPLAPLDGQDTVKKEQRVNKQGSADAVSDRKNNLDAFFSSDEWLEYQKELQMNADEISRHAQEINKHFNSAEWKQCEEELAKNSAAIAQHNKTLTSFFESPEWKTSLKSIQEKAVQLGRLAALKGDSAYFKSSEWKAKEKEMEESSRKMEQLSKQLELKMNSPEMQAKQKALEAKAAALGQQMAALSNKVIESPEFKAKQEALQKKAEELAKRGEHFNAIIKELDLSAPIPEQ